MGNSSLLNGIFGNQLWNNEFDVRLFTSYFLMVSSYLIISNRVLTRSTNPPLKSSFHDPLSGFLSSLSASTPIHPPYCPSPLLPSLSHIYQSFPVSRRYLKIKYNSVIPRSFLLFFVVLPLFTEPLKTIFKDFPSTYLTSLELRKKKRNK